MKIDPDIKLDFDDVLLVPQRSYAASRKDVNLKRNFKFYWSSQEWHGVPLMASNMDATGTFNMGVSLDSHEAITCLHKHYSGEAIASYYQYYNIQSNVWVSVGMDIEKELDRLFHIEDSISSSPNICIDIANGYTERFVDLCYEIRNEFPNSIIMAGNVATPEMVSELILHGGADIVKIGIGPGSACTTRLKAGGGYPQLSAISECSHVAHGLRSDNGRLGLICADGGCRYPADVTKAYAAGADFVMLGGMLAGHEESEVDITDGKMEFYGMSSDRAMEIHGARKDGYRGAEGKDIKIPYKGTVEDTLTEIIGGVRSACTYIGATKIKDMPKCATFVQVLQQENQVFNLFE